MSGALSTLAAERDRIRDVYRAREAASGDLYAPWQPAEEMMRGSRRRLAARLLRRAGAFPRHGDRCLEVGCGTLGWLADLIGWGVREADLGGVDLDPSRLDRARAALPGADLRVADGARLPWEDESFRLVVLSTVLSSILDPGLRRLVAEGATRVLAPGGALLLYDMAVPSPANRDVLPIGRREIRRLFPALHGEMRRVTLAPPLARAVAPRSFALATLLETLPFLRTHRLAVLVKQ